MIFQAWRCVLGDSRVTYLSGPITTGRRWIDAVATGNVIRAEIVDQNSRALIDVAARLRAESPRPVIEPASLSVRGWSQDDYLALWTELIERHAGEVRFLDDWAYSNGCAHEFERAQRHAIATIDLAGQPISLLQGVERLRMAHSELAERATRRPALAPLRDAIAAVTHRLQSAV